MNKTINPANTQKMITSQLMTTANTQPDANMILPAGQPPGVSKNKIHASDVALVSRYMDPSVQPQSPRPYGRNTAPMLRWAEHKTFIAGRLSWVGYVNRRHIQDRFQISGTVATRVMQRYLREVGGMTYNASAKSYLFTEETLTTQAVSLDQAKALGALDELDYSPLESMAVREPLPEVTRIVCAAIESHGTVAIRYLGTEKDEHKEHLINPEHMVVDGDHWYIRAYCQITRTFTFYLLNRILSARTVAVLSCPNDVEWQAIEDLPIVPSPEYAARSIRVRRATRELVLNKLGTKVPIPNISVAFAKKP